MLSPEICRRILEVADAGQHHCATGFSYPHYYSYNTTSTIYDLQMINNCLHTCFYDRSKGIQRQPSSRENFHSVIRLRVKLLSRALVAITLLCATLSVIPAVRALCGSKVLRKITSSQVVYKTSTATRSSPVRLSSQSATWDLLRQC